VLRQNENLISANQRMFAQGEDGTLAESNFYSIRHWVASKEGYLQDDRMVLAVGEVGKCTVGRYIGDVLGGIATTRCGLVRDEIVHGANSCRGRERLVPSYSGIEGTSGGREGHASTR
jgi:hypothetical protein